MEKEIKRRKIIMFAILGVIVLLIIGLATFSIIRNKKNVYKNCDGWYEKYIIKENDTYKVRVVTEFKVVLTTTKVEFVKDKKVMTRSSMWLYCNEEFKEELKGKYYRFEFWEYPNNSKKDVLKVYYNDMSIS